MTSLEHQCCEVVLLDARRILRLIERRAENEENPYLVHALELWAAELRTSIANLKMKMVRHGKDV